MHKQTNRPGLKQDVNVEHMHVVICLNWRICVGQSPIRGTLSRDQGDFSMIGPRVPRDSVVLTSATAS